MKFTTLSGAILPRVGFNSQNVPRYPAYEKNAENDEDHD
jgi:hypothetical protein